MIVLDTNVVSEAMRNEPHPAVREWLNEQSADTLYLSSVTLAEFLFGVSALPAGKRKDMLFKTLDGLMALFGERILPFDTYAARQYAKLAVAARGQGAGFPLQTATSPQLPLRAGSSSLHETPLPSRLPGAPSLTLGKPEQVLAR